MDDELLPPWLGRLAGAVLFVAGLAAAWQLLDYWNSPTWTGRLWNRLVLYAFAGGVTVLALVQGIRMITAPRGSDLALPRPLLALGVVVLFAAGAFQVILYFVHPGFGSLSGTLLGVGGALAAFRLWRRRSANSSLPPDGHLNDR